MTSLEEIAAKYDVKVIYKNKEHGHIHLKGKMLVNYYPNSVNKTAYISGMKNSRQNVSEEEAVLMAINIPMTHGIKEPRKKSYKAAKKIILKKNPHCYWCGILLTLETATLEHIIPLSRGGLNNKNNYEIACEPCNKKRGNDMPELKGKIDE